MAPNGTIQDPQLLTAGLVRLWVQRGVGNPQIPYSYQGTAQISKTDQDLGKMKPIWLPSSTQRNVWDIVDVIVDSPQLGTGGFTQHGTRLLSDIWYGVQKANCLINMKAIISKCARPDTPDQWDSQILWGRSRLEKIGLTEMDPLDGSKNAVVDIDGTTEWQTITYILPMQFTQVATVIAVAEIVDAFYYDRVGCGDCGVTSDGCQAVYALQIANAGSPGLSSQVLYATDGGYTWAGVDIPTLGGLSASRFAPMGLYCIVVSPNQAAYHYAKFTDIQAGLANWTQVTTGFTAGKSPRCITVRDPLNGWIGAQGGVIYALTGAGNAVSVLTDGTLSAQDVNDLHYYGRTIVAVQNNNGVLYSLNNGASWATVTGPLVGQNLSSVWCQSATSWFVGTGNGQLWSTINSGASWTRIIFDAGINVIDDLQMFDENIGYIACEVGGAARVYRTVDGGNTWRYSPSSEIGLLPGAPVRVDVLAPCGPNNCLAVGRKTAGGAGYIALARNAS